MPALKCDTAFSTEFDPLWASGCQECSQLGSGASEKIKHTLWLQDCQGCVRHCALVYLCARVCACEWVLAIHTSIQAEKIVYIEGVEV